MTHKDPAQMSKDELINLIFAQAQQIAKLQAEIDELNLNKVGKFQITSVNLHQPPSNEQKGNAIDQLKRHKHGLPQLHPDPILNIKPDWRTKNRLQNCHKPKPK